MADVIWRDAVVTENMYLENTITSVIAVKQTVINEVYVFFNRYRYSDTLLKNTETSFILLMKHFG